MCSQIGRRRKPPQRSDLETMKPDGTFTNVRRIMLMKVISESLLELFIFCTPIEILNGTLHVGLLLDVSPSVIQTAKPHATSNGDDINRTTVIKRTFQLSNYNPASIIACSQLRFLLSLNSFRLQRVNSYLI